MLRCKEVADLVASDAWRESPVTRRLAVWLHLAMCRHCRRYARQLRGIGAAARRIYEGVQSDQAHAARVVAAVRQAAEHAPTSTPPDPT